MPNGDLEQEVAGLYAEHAVRLLRYAETITRNRDTSRDAVQEVFLRYFAERRYGNRVENPRAWLYRVLHNHLLDRLDRAAMKYEVSAEGADEVLDECVDVETRLEQTQTAREIASRLTRRELDCLRLRVEGLSYQEIAQVLGIRPGTVGRVTAARVCKAPRRGGRGYFPVGEYGRGNRFALGEEDKPIHPDIEILVCHRFGELSRQMEKAVSKHLLQCDACRRDFQRLSAADDTTVPAAPVDDVNSLMIRLRGWERSESGPARNGEALKRRVAGAIEPYLGKRAADTLLQPVREDGRDLLSNVAPLLTMFLGRRAAGNLVTYVVETAIVRT